MIGILRAEHFPLKKESSLKFFYQKYAQRALAFAVAIHIVAVGVYWGVVYLQDLNRQYATRIITYADLGPPPALRECAVDAQEDGTPGGCWG